jgi:2-dehydro-3-deoxy-D-arabinonate dehydratase
MNVFRYLSDNGPRLGIETGDGRFDLTGLNDPAFASLGAWLRGPDPLAAIRAAARNVTEPVPDDAELLAPVDVQEVWAAGVTYERSKVARMEESESGGDFYDKVYVADRPELFFKANPNRVVAPGKPVRIRRDSTWDVPEPEMTLVVSSSGNIVGVTVGNDMSSRSIEGENPLYLPQAKSYDGSASVGPVLRIIEDASELRNLPIRLQIQRGGMTVFDDATSTARMKRTPEELVGFLFRETSFPDGVLLMTGTGLVPPDSFTLQSGDLISITIEGIGTLTNPVA